MSNIDVDTQNNYHFIKCHYNKNTCIDNIEIKCYNSILIFSKNMMTCSEPILVNIFDSTMQIWNPVYTSMKMIIDTNNMTNNMTNSMTKYVTKYLAHDFDGNVHFVSNRIILTKLLIKFDATTIIVNGKNSKIVFDDHLFDNKNVLFKFRGCNNVDIGYQMWNSVKNDVDYDNIYISGKISDY